MKNTETYKIVSVNKEIYIISNEKIVEGDYVIEQNKPQQVKNLEGVNWGNLYKLPKIIATTDTLIVPEDGYTDHLPQLPQSLIKAYAEQPFDEVELEYEIGSEHSGYKVGEIHVSHNVSDIPTRLKLTENNEVVWREPERGVTITTIGNNTAINKATLLPTCESPIKDKVYTEQEVVNKLRHLFSGVQSSWTEEDCDNWIKQNL
jgi:hypothetical protein